MEDLVCFIDEIGDEMSDLCSCIVLKMLMRACCLNDLMQGIDFRDFTPGEVGDV